MAKKKSTSKALMSIKDFKAQQQQDMIQDSDRESVSGGIHLSTKGNKFSIGDEVLPQELNMVILDYAFENADYGDALWDPENPSPPICFAVSPEEGEMAPHETSPEPQSESCEDCHYNKFKSAEVGKGKHCKNRRRLALMDADCDDPSQASVCFLKIPPTGITNWKQYHSELKKTHKIMPYGCVTRISFDEDHDNPIVKFEFIDEISDPALAMAVMEKRELNNEELYAPIDLAVREEEPKKKAGKKKVKSSPKKKAVVKKAVEHKKAPVKRKPKY